MSDITTAILNGTLCDADAIAELYARQTVFAAGAELLPEIRARGLSIFESAVATDVPTAALENEPVVHVLHRVLKDIGLLYVENGRRIATMSALVTEHAVAQGQDPVVIQVKREPTQQTDAVLTNSEDDESSKNRIEAALAARKKRKQLTHGSRSTGSNASSSNERRTKTGKRDLHTASQRLPQSSDPSSIVVQPHRPKFQYTSPSHSTTRVPAASSVPSTGEAKRPAPSKHRRTHSTIKTSNQPHNIKPSLIVKLSVPRLSELLREQLTDLFAPIDTKSMTKPETKQPTTETQDGHPKLKYTRGKSASENLTSNPEKRSDTAPRKRIARRKRKAPREFKSKEYVTSDMEDTSDVDMRKRKGRREFKSKEYVTSDMEDSDLEEHATPLHIDSEAHAAEDFTHASPREHAKPNEHHGVDTEIHVEPPHSPSPALQVTSSWATQAHPPPQPEQEAETKLATQTETETANGAEDQLLTLTFPSYPPMSPRTLGPFHRGAQTALENILDDHDEAPEDTLLDLIEELEQNRPIMFDWEHVTVMEGSTWVFGALREVCGFGPEGEGGSVDEDMEEDSEGGDGDMKGDVQNEDVDVEDVEVEKGEVKMAKGKGKQDQTDEDLQPTLDITALVSSMLKWVDLEYERLGGEE